MAFYLCFDYGMSSTGLAIGQDAIGTAQPLMALKCKKGKFDQAILDKVIQEWQPSALIMGYPLNQDGTETHLTPKVRRFGQWLIKTYNLPLFMIDERNTTTSAKEFLFEQHNFKGLSKDKVDSVAAAIMLQAYFDGEEVVEFKLDKEDKS